MYIVCSAALCSDPPAIVNGMRTFSGNSVGDTATYSCNIGFELIGDSTTTCTQLDANSGAEFPAVPPPECRREYFINKIELYLECVHTFLVVAYVQNRTHLQMLGRTDHNFKTHVQCADHT